MNNDNLNLFLMHIRAKGSENTARDYEKNIKRFFSECKKAEKDVKYEDLLIYYNENLQHLKLNSKRAYMIAVISYFKFLYQQDRLEKDITKSFKMPQAELKDMEYLGTKEALMVSRACDYEVQNKLRKKAMFVMFVNAGMRASELANLELEDIKDEWIIIKKGKGRKFRTIPLHPSVKEAIDLYIKYERRSRSPYLFVNRYGNRLTNSIINRDLDRIVGSAHIDKNITAHRLRDSFATIQYINGADIKSIQETLGHTNIQMTLHYVQKADEKRRDQVVKAGVQF
jgi:site-specific recombinase XerD